MNSIINYIIESNAGMLVFVLLYFLFFRNDTNFKIVRIIMLIGVCVSLIFPLFSLGNIQSLNPIPSLANTLSINWLPEVIVMGDSESSSEIAITYQQYIWNSILLLYLAGLIISSIYFIIQLIYLFRIISQAKIVRQSGYKIIELDRTLLTFSFFNNIFLGNANKLSTEEKQQIVDHEMVHVNQWHSVDVVLISLLKIIFWFNPLIGVYKKIFVQLHEFEADARAVENQDVDKYCSLLARVALQSAGLNLASHFNKSLTIKRIEMMRTLKTKIKWWKLAASMVCISLIFIGVACQDQLNSESEISNDGIPKEATTRFENFKQNFPGETFIVEYDENANTILNDLENKHGNAKHIELFSIKVQDKLRTFSMIQYEGSQKLTLQEVPAPIDQSDVLTVVEEQPEFQAGYPALVEFIRTNLKYPLSARTQGIEGTSYVQFIVEKDGSVSDVKVIRGINAACDAEAERVVKIFPNWIPGKQDGQVVRVRFIMPIRFKLN